MNSFYNFTEDDNYRKYSVMREGGGIPFDMGGYDLHTLFNIFGPIESVCGYAYTRNAHRPYLNPRHEKFNEDFFVNTINTMCASMKFKKGPLLSFEMSYHTLEVINAVIDSSNDGETKHLTTDFDIPKPISTEFYRGTSEERSLFLY